MWRNGTPLASRVVHGVTDHLLNCVCNLRVFLDDERGCQCPFVLCFHPQAFLRKGVRASRSYQEQTGKSGSFGLWHHPRGYVSNFLVRPASSLGALERSGTPSRHSRGIDTPVAITRGEGAQMKWFREPRCSFRVRPVCRGILRLHQGCQVPFRTSRQKVGLLLSRCSGQGPHLALMGEPRGFSRVSAGFSSYDVEFRLPIVLAQGSPIFNSICEGELAIAL